MNFLTEYDLTIERLKRTGNYSEVARRMSMRQQQLGLKGKTTQGWVSQLVSGRTTDPGYRRFCILKEVLDTFDNPALPRQLSIGQGVGMAETKSFDTADKSALFYQQAR